MPRRPIPTMTASMERLEARCVGGAMGFALVMTGLRPTSGGLKGIALSHFRSMEMGHGPEV